MGISRALKAITSAMCCITIFGITVVLLDDYSSEAPYGTGTVKAPVTSPVVENISYSEGYSPTAGQQAHASSYSAGMGPAGPQTAQANVY